MALIDFLLLRGVPLQRRRDRSTDAWCRLVGVVTRTFRPLANLRPRRCFPVSASPVWSSLDSFWRENPRRTTTYPPYASSNISDFRRRDSSLSLSLSLSVARSLFFHDKVIDIFQRNVSIGYTNVNTQRDSAIQRAYDDQRACFQTIQLFADFLLWSSCYLFFLFFSRLHFFSGLIYDFARVIGFWLLPLLDCVSGSLGSFQRHGVDFSVKWRNFNLYILRSISITERRSSEVIKYIRYAEERDRNKTREILWLK